ncbi:MAG: FHA domain-containing protein [Actinobacteria bacterium]|nr:MAG: FHA domain-containing protein [Actinomycetota bacterium]
MINLVLFIFKFIFLFFLYLFILMIAKNIFKDSRITYEVEEEASPLLQAKLVSLGRVNKESPLPDLLVIGRSENADIKLEDDFVSYNHAKIVQEGSHYYLEDLESTNGTLVNNKKVKRAKLRDGDIIAIGGNSFKFVAGN